MKYWHLRSYADFKKFAGHGDHVTPLKRGPAGVATITLREWRLLEPLLYTVSEMSHAIFRGIKQNKKCKYRLEPSIFRTRGFKDAKSIKGKNDYLMACYRHFAQAVGGRRGPLSNPIAAYKPYDLWSLGLQQA